MVVTAYHGTSSKLVDRILKEGILPNRESGVSSNSESSDYTEFADPHYNPTCVYLGDCQERVICWAVEAVRKHRGALAILEVEVDEKYLSPTGSPFYRRWEEGWAEKGIVEHDGGIEPSRIKRHWISEADEELLIEEPAEENLAALYETSEEELLDDVQTAYEEIGGKLST